MNDTQWYTTGEAALEAIGHPGVSSFYTQLEELGFFALPIGLLPAYLGQVDRRRGEGLLPPDRGVSVLRSPQGSLYVWVQSRRAHDAFRRYGAPHPDACACHRCGGGSGWVMLDSGNLVMTEGPC